MHIYNGDAVNRQRDRNHLKGAQSWCPGKVLGLRLQYPVWVKSQDQRPSNPLIFVNYFKERCLGTLCPIMTRTQVSHCISEPCYIQTAFGARKCDFYEYSAVDQGSIWKIRILGPIGPICQIPSNSPRPLLSTNMNVRCPQETV